MFTLIQLPYAMEALEPVISAETISFHHGKHLQAYVDNLNKLLPGSGFEGLSLVDIVRQAPAGAIFNNAGQILNHEMYFTQFKPAENVTEGPDSRPMVARSSSAGLPPSGRKNPLPFPSVTFYFETYRSLMTLQSTICQRAERWAARRFW